MARSEGGGREELILHQRLLIRKIYEITWLVDFHQLHDPGTPLGEA
jgi:hypothetical protein